MHQILELILFPLQLAYGLVLDVLCFPLVAILWVKDQCAALFKYACWHLSYYAHDRGWRAWEFRLRRWAGRKMTLGEYFSHLRAALTYNRARLRSMGSRFDRSYHVYDPCNDEYIRPHNFVAHYLGCTPSADHGSRYRERDFLMPLLGDSLWNDLSSAHWGGGQIHRVRLIISVYNKLGRLDSGSKRGRV